MSATLSESERDNYRRRQLLYRSRQRGWLELDLIMGSWAERYIDTLSGDELRQYELIVRQENPDLIKFIVERLAPPDDVNNAVMKRLVEYAHGDGKKWIVRAGNQS